jgi:hypothetical protein
MNTRIIGASNDGGASNSRSQSKQRVFTRLSFEHPVAWSYAPEEFGSATVRNVSRGGMCIALARYLRPGRVVRIVFKDIRYAEQPIEFAARIAWCRSSGSSDATFVAGLAVEHREPVVLAQLSEIFYAAVSRLRDECVLPSEPTFADTLTSPSLAS